MPVNFIYCTLHFFHSMLKTGHNNVLESSTWTENTDMYFCIVFCRAVLEQSVYLLSACRQTQPCMLHAVQYKCISNLAGLRESSVGEEMTLSLSLTSVLLDVVTSNVSLSDTGSDSLPDGGMASASNLLPRWPNHFLSERNGLNSLLLATALAGRSPADHYNSYQQLHCFQADSG